MNIILVGPHGVGKTTIGTKLARAFGVPFHAELGREMAEDPAWRPDGVTAADAAARFDHELFARELARDLGHTGGARVVESWHPTNLAYASQRSPEVVGSWLSAVRAACVASPSIVLHLTASRDTLAARQNEPGDLDFFREVGIAASRWAWDLGLTCAGAWHTDCCTPDELVASMVQELQPLFPSIPSFSRSLPCV